MQIYEEATTRYDESLGSVLAWARGEEEVGLKKSLFICDNGKLTLFIDKQEGEEFYESVKLLTEDELHSIFDEFLESTENKNLQRMHKGLAIFDLLDNYPELASTSVFLRLKRIRESTHEEAYNIETQDKRKNFIIHKGNIYLLER